MTDLLMRTALIQTRLHDGDLARSFVFRTILSANLSHLPPALLSAELDTEGGDPAASRRPVSANAIAQSLCMPYETVRSRVVALIATGWCRRETGGLLIPWSVTARPEYQAAVLEIHREFLDAVRTLKRIALDFDAIAGAAALPSIDIERAPRAPSPAFVVQLLMDFQQRHTEAVTPMFGDVTRAFVWAGVLQANIRRMLVEPETAWAYASQDAPPPDALRIPVSVHALSRSLGMPYETVRRQVAALVAEGRLIREPLGVLAPALSVGDERLGRGNLLLMARFARLVAELKRFGFDFDDPR